MPEQALTTTSLLRRLENLEAEIERLQAENAINWLAKVFR